MPSDMKTNGWAPKPIAPLPPKTIRGRVNIKTEKFDDLINAQGVRVKVYRTSYCPNVKSIDGGEHEINCSLCHGGGFVDCHPLETWAFIKNQSLEKPHMAEGLYDGNSVIATFMQGVELQYFTLVELLDFTEIFFERIKRQEGNIDVLKYPGVRVNFLMDKSGKQYFEGSDFKMDANGNIQWCDNKGPLSQTIYSVNYETQIRFRAIRASHVNRFVQTSGNDATNLVKMNEEWVLQKEYLVVRKDVDGNLLQPSKVRGSDDD